MSYHHPHHPDSRPTIQDIQTWRDMPHLQLIYSPRVIMKMRTLSGGCKLMSTRILQEFVQEWPPVTPS